MSIRIVKSGLLTSLQDLGRTGYQKFGVLVNGAMDTFSLRLANLLVDNAPGEAAMEMTLQGPELLLAAGTIFALSGADLAPTIKGKAVPMLRPVFVMKDCILHFGGYRRGCRGYLAVAGGFDVPVVMGSKSTYLRAAIGGYEGRALQAGDTIHTGICSESMALIRQRMALRASEEPFVAVPWFVDTAFIFESASIRAMKGMQYDWFTEQSCRDFFSEGFLVTMQSDRMGYRLEGARLALREPREMISEPIAFGAVQVADGNPILLLADRQTTGGYPKIAQVILADLPRVGQMVFDTQIHFSLVSQREAELRYLEQEKYMETLAKSIWQKLEDEAGR
jgi:antagonist of KipI